MAAFRRSDSSTRERRTAESVILAPGLGRVAVLEAVGAWSAADVYLLCERSDLLGPGPFPAWAAAEVSLWTSSGGITQVAAVGNVRSMAGTLYGGAQFVAGVICSARGRTSDLWRVEARTSGPPGLVASEATLSLEVWDEGPPQCCDRQTAAQSVPDLKGSPGLGLDDQTTIFGGPCIAWQVQCANLGGGPGLWLQLHDSAAPLVGGEPALASMGLDAFGNAVLSWPRGVSLLRGLTLALSTAPNVYALPFAPSAWFTASYTPLVVL